MKVRFLQAIASERFAYRPGDIHELDDGLVAPWLKSGVCEPYPVRESAAMATAETATVEPRRRGRPPKHPVA